MSDPSQTASYKHRHKAILDLGWEQFGEICKTFVEDIRRTFEPEAVAGIAKGGVIPAVVIASALSINFYPIKLSSRDNEKIVRNGPKLFVLPPPNVAGKRIVLVDDICIPMRTLNLARSLLEEAGAAQVVTATFAVHGFSEKPDLYALETDDVLLWPRDKEAYDGRVWSLNPEYQQEIREIEAAKTRGEVGAG